LRVRCVMACPFHGAYALLRMAPARIETQDARRLFTTKAV
jgi:hypothetical protein